MSELSQMFSVLYIPHGGGPLPVLGHEGHENLVRFLKKIPDRLGKPDAIVVISAHWEQSIPTVTTGKSPALIYDYYGFPPQAYEIEYPAPGSPLLADEILSLLQLSGIKAQADKNWGWDHGLYIPLKLMYPDADIPCVQLSLVNGLDPLSHLQIGHALAGLNKKNMLVLGSGFSFHNMGSFGDRTTDNKNIEFDDWLIETLTDHDLSHGERKKRLVAWETAPHARYCHPREEHLLPLQVCYGIAQTPAEVIFNDTVLGKRATAFLW